MMLCRDIRAGRMVIAISVDFYTRLEQGRVQASASARYPHPRSAAGRRPAGLPLRACWQNGRQAASARTVQRVRPAMGRLLDQLTQTPAIVLGRRMDILAWNPTATAMHQQWEHDARDAVAALRMEAAKDPDDPELARLVGDLSV